MARRNGHMRRSVHNCIRDRSMVDHAGHFPGLDRVASVLQRPSMATAREHA